MCFEHRWEDDSQQVLYVPCQREPDLQKAAREALALMPSESLGHVNCKTDDILRAVDVSNQNWIGQLWTNNHPITRMLVERMAILAGIVEDQGGPRNMVDVMQISSGRTVEVRIDLSQHPEVREAIREELESAALMGDLLPEEHMHCRFLDHDWKVERVEREGRTFFTATKGDVKKLLIASGNVDLMALAALTGKFPKGKKGELLKQLMEGCPPGKIPDMHEQLKKHLGIDVDVVSIEAGSMEEAMEKIAESIKEKLKSESPGGKKRSGRLDQFFGRSEN